MFKGGTALSKAYRVIRRFSEDVDLTSIFEPLLQTLSAMRPMPCLLRAARKASGRRKPESDWPHGWPGRRRRTPAEALLQVEPGGEVRVDADEIFIRYAAQADVSEYVRPEVKLEFGARATGEPNQRVAVACDAAPHVAGVSFPTAEPRVMTAERTFWEKATAAHVFCKQGRL